MRDGAHPIVILLVLGLAYLCRAYATDGAKHAVQLMVPDRNRTGLSIVESSLRMIEALENPVAVVSITGPYHTGKSFLMNHIARFDDDNAAGDVFGIGRGVDPETSGVWMYHRTLEGKEEGKGKLDVLFLDTEGFSVSNVTETYDAKVFAVATTLSSVLLYNSMHLLHASELEYLDLLAHNTQLFTIRTSLKAPGAGRSEGQPHPGPLADVFQLPPLLITVQAFTMDLGGEQCNSWLERLLAAPVRSVKEEQHLGLGALFPSTGCQTMFLPATSREELNNLAGVPKQALTKDFRNDLDQLVTNVRSKVQPKVRAGQALTGPALASLIRLVVDALGSGDLSEIPGRWELFEEHLRQSSVRACMTAIDAEVKRQLGQWARPLTPAELEQVLSSAEAHGRALLKRLLVGLDKSIPRAAKEAEKGIAELKHKFQEQNSQNIAAYLQAQADDVKRMDDVLIHDFKERTPLPVPTKQLESWNSEREAAAAALFKSKEQGGMFKEDTHFGQKLKDLAGKVKASSDRLRLENIDALDKLMEDHRAAGVAVYNKHLVNKVTAEPIPHETLASMASEVNKAALEHFATGAERFKHEKVYDLFESKLKVDLGNILAGVKKQNAQKIREFCNAQKNELVTRVAADVAQLAQAVFDEEELESGLSATTGEVVTRFAERVKALRAAPECANVEKELKAEVAGIQDKARQVLADKIRRVLQEPLSEICKRIIVAKCPSYTSVASFTSDVQKECSYFARKHDIGAKLSNKMMTTVINRFIDTDLRVCREMVRKEEERRTFWRRMTGGLGAIVALAAYLRYQSWSQTRFRQGLSPARIQHRDQPFWGESPRSERQLPYADMDR